MKSLFLKLFNLQRKILSDAERKKFFKNKNSKIHSSFKLGGNNFLDISDTAEITIHENVYINESNHITIKRNGKFIVGKNSYITRGTFSCLDRVEIGENCLLGEGMKLFDHNHQYSTNPFVVHKTDFNTAPIKIGNNVWSGANCVILKGVTIGDNVILGAGCIIHKDVPANSIVMNKQELIIKKLQND